MPIFKQIPPRSTTSSVDLNLGSKIAGKREKIIRALYGGKSASTCKEMKFESCKADPDVWFRPAIRSNGTPYYQYVLLYPDDILAISEEPEKFIREELDSCFVVQTKVYRSPIPVPWK